MSVDNLQQTSSALNAWYKHSLTGFSSLLNVAIESGKKHNISDADFREILFMAVNRYGVVEPKELSEKFGVSASTTTRWIGGSNFPHPVIRPYIVGWVKKCVDHRIAVTSGDADDLQVVSCRTSFEALCALAPR